MEVDWLTINPMYGGTGQTEVYAYVTANENPGITRKATVRFTNTAGLYADLNLSQTSDTSDMRFVVDPDILEVPGIGATLYAYVWSNTAWKVSEYDSGLTITTDNQEGIGDGILTIVFPTNPNNTIREGDITVISPMGTELIHWVQGAYNEITVTPNKLIFPQTGGTLSVTVKSYADWTLVSYDSAHTSFSVMSGGSGETVVSVTKVPLTPNQIAYYYTCPSEAVFSDGNSTAVLSIDSNLDDYYIDDDWITVYYNVPEANTQVYIYGWDFAENLSPTVWYQDENHTEEGRSIFGATGNRQIIQYYTTFTTAGEHIIKYKFNKPGSIIPKWCFLHSSPYIDKIVVGNRCEGVIEACAAIESDAREVILGLGNITGIGEFAFEGCGSMDKDFVLGLNVGELIFQPFHNMKARKFIYDQETLGDSASTVSQSGTTGGGAKKLSIRDHRFTWEEAFVVTGTTQASGWYNYPGDITCTELVLGAHLQTIYNTPFYPFGIIGPARVALNEYKFDWPRAGISYTGEFTYENGWDFSILTCLGKTSPTVTNYAFTPVIQTYTRKKADVNYGTFATYRMGPERTIPFHYPIGADYSGWSISWTNMYGDIDI